MKIGRADFHHPPEHRIDRRGEARTAAGRFANDGTRRNGLFDYAATFVGFVFYSTPIFFLSLMLVLWFSLNLGWFPAQAPQGATVAEILSEPAGLVLPVASLVLLDVALFSRYMRSATLDNLVQDYVRTAYAKGAGERRGTRAGPRLSCLPAAALRSPRRSRRTERTWWCWRPQRSATPRSGA